MGGPRTPKITQHFYRLALSDVPVERIEADRDSVIDQGRKFVRKYGGFEGWAPVCRAQ